MKWLKQPFFRRHRYDDLSASIQEHLEEKIEELMEDGVTREEATRTARRQFGNVTLMEERSREIWQWQRLESLWADTKFGLRQLFKSPAFTTTAILTLALGIGANTGVFTLVHALLLKNLPIPEPDRLVRIEIDSGSSNPANDELPLNYFLMQSLQRHAKSFSGIFGWSSIHFVLREGNDSRIYPGAIVSGNAFQVLDITPAAGRLLTPQDDQQGGGPDGWAAVISYRFWRQHYDADPSVIGKNVTLSGHSVRIVGVTPQGFDGVLVGTQPDFYLPLEYEPVIQGNESILRSQGSVWLRTWARLKPGVSIETASAEMNSLFRIVMEETAPSLRRHLIKTRFVVRPGRNGWSILQLHYKKPLLLLQILVGVVLLVCCMNLAGLCWTRTARREHEFAVRGALGAARSRLMQQLLVEFFLLALLGSALAIAFAWIMDRYLLQFLGNQETVASLSVRPDLATLLLTGGCAIVCTLLFGIAPAWLASHVPVEPALRRSGQNVLAGKNALIRRLFVPAQIALSLALVVLATMLGTTVMNLRTENLGFHTENVLFATAYFDGLPQKGLDLVHLYGKMTSRMEQMPGVESASVAQITPLNGWRHTEAFSVHSSFNSEGDLRENYVVNDVGSHYFATLGTQMLAGRDFSGQDADANTCILNRSAAKMLSPQSPIIGHALYQHVGSTGSEQAAAKECQVIGIVEDAKYDSLRETAPPTVYLPFGVHTRNLSSLSFLIHARTLMAGETAYRKALQEFAPGSPEAEPISFSAQFNDSISTERLLSLLSGFFAVLALLLSGIGIYGLMTSYVTQRTTEIGVRMAFGATHRQIFTLVMRQVSRLLLLGTLLGACLAVVAAHSIQSFLFDVSAGNPAIFLFAVVILALAGFVAAMLPARRAVSIDPMQALRNE